jgi:predicted secreted protein
MVLGYTKIVYGTQTLHLLNINKRRVPGTVKQKIGRNLVKHNVPGRDVYDYEITANGYIFDSVATTATAFRTTLESYDDLTKRHYTDGLITGSFIIEDLTFPDDANNPLHYTYRIKLIEYNQP